jgi:hypothetical protein
MKAAWRRGGRSALGTSPASSIFSAHFDARVRDRRGAHERARVGMPGHLVQRVARRDLDDLAEVHDRYLVGDVSNNGEIVGEQEIRRA